MGFATAEKQKRWLVWPFVPTKMTAETDSTGVIITTTGSCLDLALTAPQNELSWWKHNKIENAAALMFSHSQPSFVDGTDWVPLSSVHYENLLFFHDKVTITRHPIALERWLPWAITASSHSTFLWITSAVSIVWQKPGTERNLLTVCSPVVR